MTSPSRAQRGTPFHGPRGLGDHLFWRVPKQKQNRVGLGWRWTRSAQSPQPLSGVTGSRSEALGRLCQSRSLSPVPLARSDCLSRVPRDRGEPLSPKLAEGGVLGRDPHVPLYLARPQNALETKGQKPRQGPGEPHGQCGSLAPTSQAGRGEGAAFLPRSPLWTVGPRREEDAGCRPRGPEGDPCPWSRSLPLPPHQTRWNSEWGAPSSREPSHHKGGPRSLAGAPLLSSPGSPPPGPSSGRPDPAF